MKYIVSTLRILIGLLFIFSGMIKANDPTGFSYKLDEYFTVFAEDLGAQPDSFRVSLTVNGAQAEQNMAFGDEAELQVVMAQLPWTLLEVEEGTMVRLSSAKLSVGGNVIHEADLVASDSGERVEEIALVLSREGTELYSRSFDLVAGSSASAVDAVDVAPYLKQDAWYVGAIDGLRAYAIPLAIFICVLEIVLGFALLIGWAARFTLGMYLALLLFFAFLTWYSASFDKVTDCGCFGDAIKLTPWQSFNKDLILLGGTLILFVGVRYIRPLFSNPFSVRFLTLVTVGASAFGLYCWHYLPVWDFLQYSEGSDIRKKMEIPEGGRERDHIVREYFYSAGQEKVTVVWDSDDNSFTPEIQSDWTYIGVGEDKVLEKRDDPPIHDFKIMDETLTYDYVDDFFSASRFKLMIVMNDLDQSRLSSIPKIKELVTAFREKGYEIYPLTASSPDEVAQFKHEHQLDFPFYYGDKTNLKSIIRSNPGVVLVDSSTVVRSWPSTRLPKAKSLMKLVE